MSEVVPISGDWQSKMAVPHCFWHMVENQVGCDVIFEVGDEAERIGAHTFILMSRSHTFFKQFIAGTPDKEIEVANCSPDVFRIFLRYLYTGIVDLEKTDTDKMQSLAEKYNITGLLDLCLSSKFTSLQPETFCTFLQKYEKQLNGYTKTKAVDFVLQHTHAVFTSKDFIEMPRDFLEEILNNDHLYMNEEQLCAAVLGWAGHACENEGLENNGENQRAILGDILYSIRFPLVGQDYFTEHVSETGLLDTAEEMQLLKYFLNPKKAVVAKFKFKLEKRNPSVNTQVKKEVHVTEDQPIKRQRTEEPDVSQSTSMEAVNHNALLENSIEVTYNAESEGPVFSGGMAIVNRFMEEGTGWGYRGNKKDAIAFNCSRDITLEGVLIYGNCKQAGKLEVTVTVQLSNGKKVGSQLETLDTVTETPLYDVMFDFPISLTAKTDYHVVLSAKGDTGFYGKGGQEMMTSNGVNFIFKRSKFSTNNTTTSIGQIAGFKFHLA